MISLSLQSIKHLKPLSLNLNLSDTTVLFINTESKGIDCLEA